MLEMIQLLKLLDVDHYVFRYKVCDDKVIVRDIIWTHHDSIKLLITFCIVLIIDSTYKTNKYRLPLMEIIGVTSTKKTFSMGFGFLESEKYDNVARALKMFKTILKDRENMPNVIFTDRDTTLMNLGAKVFPIICITLLVSYNQKCEKSTKTRGRHQTNQG